MVQYMIVRPSQIMTQQNDALNGMSFDGGGVEGTVPTAEGAQRSKSSLPLETQIHIVEYPDWSEFAHPPQRVEWDGQSEDVVTIPFLEDSIAHRSCLKETLWAIENEAGKEVNLTVFKSVPDDHPVKHIAQTNVAVLTLSEEAGGQWLVVVPLAGNQPPIVMLTAPQGQVEQLHPDNIVQMPCSLGVSSLAAAKLSEIVNFIKSRREYAENQKKEHAEEQTN
ncbi:MAG: hypothetical protein RIS36_671 [Pseudomonadota bacterium]|jgi:hypothetical protein